MLTSSSGSTCHPCLWGMVVEGRVVAAAVEREQVKQLRCWTLVGVVTMTGILL